MSEPLSDNFARSCRNAYELKRSESVGIEEEDEETDADVASFDLVYQVRSVMRSVSQKRTLDVKA